MPPLGRHADMPTGGDDLPPTGIEAEMEMRMAPEDDARGMDDVPPEFTWYSSVGDLPPSAVLLRNALVEGGACGPGVALEKPALTAALSQLHDNAKVPMLQDAILLVLMEVERRSDSAVKSALAQVLTLASGRVKDRLSLQCKMLVFRIKEAYVPLLTARKRRRRSSASPTPTRRPSNMTITEGVVVEELQARVRAPNPAEEFSSQNVALFERDVLLGGNEEDMSPKQVEFYNAAKDHVRGKNKSSPQGTTAYAGGVAQLTTAKGESFTHAVIVRSQSGQVAVCALGARVRDVIGAPAGSKVSFHPTLSNIVTWHQFGGTMNRVAKKKKGDDDDDNDVNDDGGDGGGGGAQAPVAARTLRRRTRAVSYHERSDEDDDERPRKRANTRRPSRLANQSSSPAS